LFFSVQAVPPPAPLEEEFNNTPITAGRVFSNTYLRLSQEQQAYCHLCQDNATAVPGLMYTTIEPENLCVKCLVSIAKQTYDLYTTNIHLQSSLNDLG
jgi:hypothetical protein